MTPATIYDVIIVGGGLAGLTAAIRLGSAGKKTLLLEKKTYPYHKVCGEYVSKEVLAYLCSLGFDPFKYDAANISKLRISTPSGKSIYAPLDLGAFALSRYTMDKELADIAKAKAAEVLTKTRVTDIQLLNDTFTVSTQTGETYHSKFVIGSWGKRETLDKKLNRSFIDQHMRYMGVKYHIRTDYPIDEIGLDNFEGGYCGIVKIEGDKYNLCNFYRRPADNAKHKSIQDYEHDVVFKNPIIKNIFNNSDFLFNDPVVINEVNFAPKPPVEQHILMCGDTAGLITPLCGNGMSMAITGSKILCDMLLQIGLLDKDVVSTSSRQQLETQYIKAWSSQFKQRLFWGRTIQGMFGNKWLTEASVRLLHSIPMLERSLIKATHGKPLVV
ncbi:MAG: NAD(P)/FAD-dependent oxidoreductase [Sphingobacteriales bacterium]|nr:MAG: NAD(P)/FAD-dependent oxidoreductase [Sphingobacteriales bacterium]